MVPDEAIAGILSLTEILDGTTMALVEAANAAGGRDNVSVILFCPDGSIDSGIAAAAALTGKIAPENMENHESDKAGSIPAGDDFHELSLVGRVRRFFSTLGGRVVIGVVLAMVLLGGAWLLTRQAYYLGVEGDHVVIYRGVPYDLGPWSLSGMYRNSIVLFSDLEPFEQDRIRRQELQSRSDAEKMLDNLSAQARERKLEAEKRAAEEAARLKSSPQNLTVPPGGLP